MKRFLLIMVAAMSLMACASHKDATRQTIIGTRDADVSPHTLIISYDPQVGKQPLMDAVKAKKCEEIYDYQNFNMVAVRLPDGLGLAEGKAYFEQVKGVLQVSYDHIYHLDSVH